jgi:FemAB-related protein (PEP-CTERM system-associated)
VKTILATTNEEGQLWQQFVDSHGEADSCHCWGWKEVIETSHGWRTFYLMLIDRDKVEGVLPLVWQRSWLFGNFLTSMPHLNGGGVLARSQPAEDALVGEAIAVARRLGATYLELRYRRLHGLRLPTKTNKVAMVRSVDPDIDGMWQSLDHKVRTDIRKGKKSKLVIQFGAAELLDEFYDIFAVKMRDLGTPVHSRGFFHRILSTFPNSAHICVVRHGGTGVAASFLCGYRDKLEAIWSCSLAEYRSLRPNMLLYWELLCFAGKKGYHHFDFGRSSIYSGTYRFKMQWGSHEVPLFWTYWQKDGSVLPELNPENHRRYGRAIKLWQKLPVALTKLVGPPIVKRLP